MASCLVGLLQTLAVLQWVLTFLAMGLTSLVILIYLLFTRFWWVTCLYAAWYIYDLQTPLRGGRQMDSIKKWKLWRYFRDYFPISLIKTTDLDPSKNYIFGFHPHGVLSVGAFCHFGTEATDFSLKFPGISAHLLVLRCNFLQPIFRDYFMCTGAGDVGRESIDHLLSQGPGKAVAIVTGGAPEAFEAIPGTFTVILRARFGFIKTAMKHGASLVPVVSFGENELFDQKRYAWLFPLQEFILQKFTCAPALFMGRFPISILPHRRPINTIVGAPIDVPKNTDPSKEEVQALHAKYVAAVIDLFEKNKEKYAGNKDLKLTIV